MKQMKSILSLLLALGMCLSLCACGTTSVEEKLFSEKYMKGVEHDGFKIKADTATAEQVHFASNYQSIIEAAVKAEGYEYLRHVTLYYLTSDENGQWYVPVIAMMPCTSAEDVYSNAWYTCNASFGRITLALASSTFALSEEEMAVMRTDEGWGEMNEKQMHLATLADTLVASLDIDYDQDYVTTRYNDNFSFAAVEMEVDGVIRDIWIQTNVLDQGANGEYAVAATILTIDDMHKMSEEEYAVFYEILGYYNFEQWFSEEGE